MAAPGIPQNLYVQQGNRQVYLSWDILAGATSYTIYRSVDGVSFSSIATPSLNNYLDATVVSGTQYYYKISGSNLSGEGLQTPAQSIIPTPTGEMSLGQIRLAAQQRADRVNSNFVSLPEWNSYINQSIYELYDLLIDSYEDYFIAPPALFYTNGSNYFYPLPDGVLPFKDLNLNTFVAPPFYKLTGVDLGINNANNAFVTMNRFNFIDRNRFVYPNTASTIYGVFNLQYRVLGNQIEFIPTPSANQPIRIWYIPRLPQLLQDTDITTTSISGWIEYVIVDAAIKALQKEESDVQVLMAQKMALKDRIESAAVNRDAGMPDKISDVRQNGYMGDGRGFNGPTGGW